MPWVSYRCLLWLLGSMAKVVFSWHSFLSKCISFCGETCKVGAAACSSVSQISTRAWLSKAMGWSIAQTSLPGCSAEVAPPPPPTLSAEGQHLRSLTGTGNRRSSKSMLNAEKSMLNRDALFPFPCNDLLLFSNEKSLWWEGPPFPMGLRKKNQFVKTWGTKTCKWLSAPGQFSYVQACFF